MINLQFNQHCPFCNKFLSQIHDNTFYCYCPSTHDIYLKLSYDPEDCTPASLHHIMIESHRKNKEFYLAINFSSNIVNIYTFQKNYLSIPYIPDFNSIQDIFTLYNTLMIFS